MSPPRILTEPRQTGRRFKLYKYLEGSDLKQVHSSKPNAATDGMDVDTDDVYIHEWLMKVQEQPLLECEMI